MAHSPPLAECWVELHLHVHVVLKLILRPLQDPFSRGVFACKPLLVGLQVLFREFNSPRPPTNSTMVVVAHAMKFPVPVYPGGKVGGVYLSLVLNTDDASVSLPPTPALSAASAMERAPTQ